MLAMLGGATEVAVNLTVPGIVALVAGILILLIPRLLNFIVAAYLIVIGFIQVFDVTL
jgi:hypothetical protein